MCPCPSCSLVARLKIEGFGRIWFSFGLVVVVVGCCCSATVKTTVTANDSAAMQSGICTIISNSGWCFWFGFWFLVFGFWFFFFFGCSLDFGWAFWFGSLDMASILEIWNIDWDIFGPSVSSNLTLDILDKLTVPVLAR